MNKEKKIKIQKTIAIILTIVGVGAGFFISPYLIAMTLGMSTIYLTILEITEDWLLGLFDLAFTGILMLGGSQIGVFGIVVSMGIAFGSTLFLPAFVRERLPFMSIKCWREGKVFGRKQAVSH